MAQLKAAKQVQSRTQQTKNKLRTTAAQVQVRTTPLSSSYPLALYSKHLGLLGAGGAPPKPTLKSCTKPSQFSALVQQKNKKHLK